MRNLFQILILLCAYAATLAPTTPEEKSEKLPTFIAVLPFSNRTGDEKLDWLAVGLQDAITVDLYYLSSFQTRALPEIVSGLGLAPAQITSTAEGKIHEIGQKLYADVLLIGQYEKNGDELILKAQLFEVKNEAILARADIAGMEKNVLKLGTELLLNVIGRLDVDVSTDEQTRMRRHKSENTRAVELNAKGFEKYGEYFLSHDIQKLEEAISFFEEATKIDAHYAEAFNNLGWALYVKGSYDDALDAFETALKRKSELIDALAGKGLILYQQRKEYKSALAVLEKAVQLNHSLPVHHVYLGDTYSWLGEWDLAIEQYTRAMLLTQNPKDKGVYLARASIAENRGNLEAALAKLLESLKTAKEDETKTIYFNAAYGALDALHYEAAEVMKWGEYEEAKALFLKLLQLAEEFGDYTARIQTYIWQDYNSLARVYSLLGKRENVIRAYENALEIYQKLKSDKSQVEMLKARALSSNPTMKKYSNSLDYEAFVYFEIGRTFFRLGKDDIAATYFSKSIARYKMLEDKKGEVSGRRLIAITHRRQMTYGQQIDYSKAIENAKLMLELYRELHDRKGEADAYEELAEIYDALDEDEKAIQHYLSALQIYQELDDKEGQAKEHHNLGRLYYSTYRIYEKALEHLEAALKIHTEMNNELGILLDYNEMIKMFNEINLDKAIEYSIAALNISENLIEREEKRLSPDMSVSEHDLVKHQVRVLKEQTAQLYKKTAQLYVSLGKYEDTLDYYRGAINLYDEIKELSLEDEILQVELMKWKFDGCRDMAKVLANLGRLDEAEAYMEKAIDYYRSVGDTEREFWAYLDISMILRDRLNSRGIIYLEQARERAKAAKCYDKILHADYAICEYYIATKQYKEAKEYIDITINDIEEYKELLIKDKQHSAIGVSYAMLAFAAFALNDTHEADKYAKLSMEFFAKGKEAGAKELEGYIPAVLPIYVLTSESPPDEFLKDFDSILKLVEFPELQFSVNRFYAIAYLLKKDYDKSLEHSLKAVAIAEKFPRPNILQEPHFNILQEAHFTAGQSYEHQGKYAQAFEHYKSSIEIIEQMRTQVGLAENRMGLFGEKLSPYKSIVKLLLKMHELDRTAEYDKLAFHYIERTKARGLLEQLQEAQAEEIGGIPPEMLAKEQDFNNQLIALEKKFTEEVALPKSEQHPELIRWLEQKNAQVEGEFRKFKAKLEEEYPKYVALKYPKPYTYEQAMEYLRDDETVLLQYFVASGDEGGKARFRLEHQLGSRLYIISKELNNPLVYRFAGSEELEELVTQYRETLAKPLVYEERESDGTIHIIDNTEKHHRLGYQLYQILLKPLLDEKSDWLKGKRFIIIPDGILHYLPFETLITNPPETAPPHYLIQLDYHISYAPSASVFGEIQQEKEQRKGKLGKDTRKEIFAVGDAIFDVTEFQAERKKQKEAQPPQLAIAQSEPQTASAKRSNKFGLSRGDYEQSGYSLQRLPNTAVELAEIQKVYGSQAEIHLRLEATEELVKSGKLSNFKIIHFAVHGILNERVPLLSAVVLTEILHIISNAHS